MFYSFKEFFDYTNTDQFFIAFLGILFFISFIIFIGIFVIDFIFNYSSYKDWKNEEKEKEAKIRIEVEEEVRKKMELRKK